jgi:hypothetical protein
MNFVQLCKSEQRAIGRVSTLRNWTARQSDIVRSGRVGRYPSSRRPFDRQLWKTASRSQLRKFEKYVNFLRQRHYVLKLSGLLLGFSLCSYHVRELLVCWLFFRGLFVFVGLVISGGVIAVYAGNYALHWANNSARVALATAMAAGKLRLKTVSSVEKLK